MTKKSVFYGTLIHGAVYCVLAAAAVWLVTHGGPGHMDRAFMGMYLTMGVVLDPLGLILSVAGMVTGRPKWPYAVCLTVTTAAWLLCICMVAPYF